MSSYQCILHNIYIISPFAAYCICYRSTYEQFISLVPVISSVSVCCVVGCVCFHVSVSISVFQSSDVTSGWSTRLSLSAVSEPKQTTMSADTACRSEQDSENPGELADLVAAMNVASNRMTPPNGYRSGPPRRAPLSDRKMSLQERGSRIARQPTIETKRVSITDADVSRPQLH